MKCIINGNIILPDSIVSDKGLAYDEKIIGIYDNNEIAKFSDSEKIDADGNVSRIEVVRSLPKSDSPLTDALYALLSGTTSTDKAKGLRSLIPEEIGRASCRERV